MPQDSMALQDIQITLRSSLQATFSPATLELLQEATKTDPDSKVISKILKLDPALSANVLALANSPHYGQAGKIIDLSRAIFILGINEILRLALSFSFHTSLNNLLQQKGFDVFANWRVIIWSALGAELVAQHIAPEEKNTAYLCTLLKDLSLFICAATFPEYFLSLTTKPPAHHGLTYTTWHNHAPINHAELTAKILTEWNLPQPMIKAIATHHDCEHVQDHPSLNQAVILGTRWAEVEFCLNSEPDSLNELGFLLSKIGALPDHNLDSLRQQCATLFESLCTTMNIVELPQKDRFYSLSLHAIQNFYYQSKEIEGLTGGLWSVASCIAKHLRWNWSIIEAEIELYSPSLESYQYFIIQEGQISSSTQAQKFCLGSSLQTSYPLKVEDDYLGNIHVRKAYSHTYDAAEVNMYSRLLAKSYRQYVQTIGKLEQKAGLLDILPIGIALLDAQGIITQTNDLFSRHICIEISPGTHFEKTLNHNGLDVSRTGWLHFLYTADQSSHCMVYCPLGVQPDTNSSQCFTLSSYKVETGQGRAILILVQDLSEIRILELEALKQRDFLTQLLATMQDLAFTVDKSGIITFASGKHAPFLQGKNLFHIARPLRAYAEPWDMEHLTQSTMAVETYLDLDGDQLILELIFSKFSHGNDYGLVVGRNISKIRRLEHKIKEQALFDALTQVLNRHHLEPMLEREILRSRRTGYPMGMIFFDIDKFKNFNDTHGHHIGDQALRDLGQIMRNMLRAGQDYPYRFGGDEFVIIIGDTNEEKLYNIAQRLQTEFRRQYNNELSLSIGASVLEPEDTAQSLLRRCDKANYKAKAQGGFAIVHLQT